MKNIEKFKELVYYSGNHKLTKDEAESKGLPYGDYKDLDGCAYQAAYDISNDWAKENPDWHDVEKGYKMGVWDGIKFIEEFVYKKSDEYYDIDSPSWMPTAHKVLHEIIDYINDLRKDE